MFLVCSIFHILRRYTEFSSATYINKVSTYRCIKGDVCKFNWAIAFISSISCWRPLAKTENMPSFINPSHSIKVSMIIQMRKGCLNCFWDQHSVGIPWRYYYHQSTDASEIPQLHRKLRTSSYLVIRVLP